MDLNFFISASLIPELAAAGAAADDDPTVAALFRTLGVAFLTTRSSD